jgi:hypothetical protein
MYGRKFTIVRKPIWKNELPDGWSTKNRTNVQNWKNRVQICYNRLKNFNESQLVLFKGDQLDISKTGRVMFFF